MTDSWVCIVCDLGPAEPFHMHYEAGDRPPFPDQVIGLCLPHADALVHAGFRPAVKAIPQGTSVIAPGMVVRTAP